MPALNPSSRCPLIPWRSAGWRVPPVDPSGPPKGRGLDAGFRDSGDAVRRLAGGGESGPDVHAPARAPHAVLLRELSRACDEQTLLARSGGLLPSMRWATRMGRITLADRRWCWCMVWLDIPRIWLRWRRRFAGRLPGLCPVLR